MKIIEKSHQIFSIMTSSRGKFDLKVAKIFHLFGGVPVVQKMRGDHDS